MRIGVLTFCQMLQQVFRAADIITDSGGSPPPGSNPFRTEPAVDVARGSDVVLPAGQISLEFTAGLMRLAAMLAHEPRLTAQVWHKAK